MVWEWGANLQSRPTIIYLVRHAQSEHNVDWDNGQPVRTAGPLESGLTPRGVKQARDLGGRLRDVPIHGVWSSHLLRARQTAAIIAQVKGLSVNATERLREHYLGALEQQRDTAILLRTFRRIERQQRGLTDREKLRVKVVADMESEEEAAARLKEFLTEVASQFQGETIVVVSHGVIMRAFLIVLGFAPYAALRHSSVANGGYVRLRCANGEFVVEDTHGVQVGG
jgi:broad specificity phosphatase PhoE